MIKINPRLIFSYLLGLIGFGFLMILGGFTFRSEYNLQLIGLILAIALLIIWFAWSWKNHSLTLPHHGIQWSILLVLAIQILGLANSKDPRQGLDRASWLVGYVLFFYYFLNTLKSANSRWGLMAGLATTTGLVLFFADLETYLWYHDWFQTAGSFTLPPAQYRFNGLLMSGPTMALANLMVFGVLLTFFRSRRLLIRVMAGLWLVLYGFALPFSSSRSGWLGFTVGTMLIFAYWVWQRQLWRVLLNWWPLQRWLFGGSILILIAGAVLLVPRFLVLFASHASHGGDPFGTSGRDQIWSNAVQIWQTSPWLGVGPWRFGLEYLLAEPQTPPGFWPMNAHNVFLQLLAEFGVIGLALWVILLLAVAAWCWRQFKSTARQDRLKTMVWIAGLSALFIQLFFDELSAWSAVIIPAIFLLAWIRPPDCDQVSVTPRWDYAWVVAPTVLILGIISWELWGYQPYAQAIQAVQAKDWRQAALLTSESASRDPSFHFYQVQSGILWAWTWNDQKDSESLAKARAYLAQGLQDEPTLSWVWADLAILDKAAGEPQTALDHYNRAIALSPQVGLYYFNRGALYEQLNQDQQALCDYVQALLLDTAWEDITFWQSSALRANALQMAMGSQSQTENISETGYWKMAQDAIRSGNLDNARRSIEMSRLMNEDATRIYQTQIMLNDASGVDSGPFIREFQQKENKNRTILFDGVNYFYSAFISNRTGIDIDLVPEMNYGLNGLQ